MENLENMKAEMLAAIAAVQDMKAWDEVRVSLSGKKGKITEFSLAALEVQQNEEQ